MYIKQFRDVANDKLADEARRVYKKSKARAKDRGTAVDGAPAYD